MVCIVGQGKAVERVKVKHIIAHPKLHEKETNAKTIWVNEYEHKAGQVKTKALLKNRFGGYYSYQWFLWIVWNINSFDKLRVFCKSKFRIF